MRKYVTVFCFNQARILSAALRIEGIPGRIPYSNMHGAVPCLCQDSWLDLN